jgi:O-antigen/teichoic acid export membrane protein
MRATKPIHMSKVFCRTTTGTGNILIKCILGKLVSNLLLLYVLWDLLVIIGVLRISGLVMLVVLYWYLMIIVRYVELLQKNRTGS